MGTTHSRLTPLRLSFRSPCSLGRRRAADSGNDAGSCSGSTSVDPGLYASYLDFYDEASRSDERLRSFGTAVRQRASDAIAAVRSSASASASASALSLSSLRAVTSVVFDTNRDAVDLILASGDNLRASKELSELVDEYIKGSLETLSFCVSLSNCLRKARDRQLLLRHALAIFANRSDSSRHERALEELRKFREAGDPFSDEFFRLFRSVREQQEKLLRTIRDRIRRLDWKLRRARMWRRITTVIFVSAFSAMLICSVVAAALAAPPAVTALAGAGTAAVGPVGSWFNSLWRGYLEGLEEERAKTGVMERATEITIEELKSIWALVKMVEGEMEGLARDAEFADRGGEEAVVIGVEEVKRKLEEFTASIEELEGQLERCRDFIKKARATVLRRITSQQGGWSNGSG